MSLFKKDRKPELMSRMEGLGMEIPRYLEPSTNAEHKKTAFDCLKEHTKKAGPLKNGDKAAYVLPRQ